MNFRSVRVHLVYFSPTGTTRKILEQIASGIGTKEIRTHDLTLPAGLGNLHLNDGLTIIGVPVYAGRVPLVCLQRLEQLSGGNQPAVLVVLYGNREFEDALVELQDVVEAKGFKVIAAAAFIGEHSYSTPEQPVAANRPDQDDLEKATAFGRSIAEQLKVGMPDQNPAIPGNRPYRDRLPRPTFTPELDSGRCIACGACIDHCPTSAISKSEESMETDAAACILCCACVKICSERARHLDHPMVQERRRMLVENCSHRKEPAIFMAAS